MAKGEHPLPVALAARPRREPLGAGGLRVRAPAKLNLHLSAGARGRDGYHPIDSLVAKVTLYDRIDLRRREDGRIAFGCRGADCGPDEENLALRAARALGADAAGGADVTLTKRIAAGRGLAGGSSDAAAVLDGLNELLGIGADPARLAALAAGLGSDVPLFLGGPAARITGRGERVEPLAVHAFLAVLYAPPFACATGEVYRAYDAGPLAAAPPPDPARLAGAPPSAWRGTLHNALGEAARRVCPLLGQAWDRLAKAVGRPVGLTGSGSALFVLCDDAAEAGSVMGAVPGDLRPACVVVRSNPW